jgi:hypothetical protein
VGNGTSHGLDNFTLCLVAFIILHPAFFEFSSFALSSIISGSYEGAECVTARNETVGVEGDDVVFWRP